MNVFAWIRSGVRRAVLDGIADAARELAAPPPADEPLVLELPEARSEPAERAKRKGGA
jgi:hypothetical protein